jgi:transposase
MTSTIASLVDEASKYRRQRFYNSNLREVYESCALPTKEAFAAPAVLASAYSTQTERKSAWNHTISKPPPDVVLPASATLSTPFLNFCKVIKPEDLKPSKKRSRGKSAPKNDEVASECRVYKVRIRPTPAQKKALKLAFAVARKAYNFANHRVRNGGARPNWYELRKDWTKRKKEAEADLNDELHWITVSKVHTQMQGEAIKQLATAYKSSDTNKRNGNIKGEYAVQYRSLRKTFSETLELNKASDCGPLNWFRPLPYTTKKKHAQCLVMLTGHFTSVGGFLVEDTPKVIEKMVTEGKPLVDCQLHWDKRLDTFHFIYKYNVPLLLDPDPTFQSKRVVAADPGVYPFQAFYSPTSGEHGRLLDGETETLVKRCQELDRLQSRVDRQQKGVGRRRRRQRRCTRKRLQRRLVRERKRLSGWIQAAHYDCANLMLQSHDLIIQPIFKVSRMVVKETRNIQSKTVRMMTTWSHYKYRERLKSASIRYAGRHVIDSTEPGTSKTCTSCGAWNADLKVRDKTFACPSCGIRVDRQIAGARNNFFAAYGLAVGVGWDGVGG